MKTDDLIRALTADRAGMALPPGRSLGLAVAAGLAFSAIGFAVALGPRPDLTEALSSARFLFKPLLMLALAAVAGLLLLRLAQPGAPVRMLVLAAIPLALAVAVLAELATLPQAQWNAALVGDNWYVCISLIPLLALPPVVALFFALRSAAPTRPAAAGAIAGLLGGGLAATLYAINCTDDSPLFVATWYSLALAALAAVGAFAGARLLRW